MSEHFKAQCLDRVLHLRRRIGGAVAGHPGGEIFGAKSSDHVVAAARREARKVALRPVLNGRAVHRMRIRQAPRHLCRTCRGAIRRHDDQAGHRGRQWRPFLLRVRRPAEERHPRKQQADGKSGHSCSWDWSNCHLSPLIDPFDDCTFLPNTGATYPSTWSLGARMRRLRVSGAEAPKSQIVGMAGNFALYVPSAMTNPESRMHEPTVCAHGQRSYSEDECHLRSATARSSRIAAAAHCSKRRWRNSPAACRRS